MGRLVFQRFLHTDRYNEVAMCLHSSALLLVDTFYAPALFREMQSLCSITVAFIKPAVHINMNC